MRPDVPAKSPEVKPDTGGYQALMLSPDDIDTNASTGPSSTTTFSR